MNKSLKAYMSDNLYTPIQNLMMNNRSKDWYAELGKYIDETVDISTIPDFSYFETRRPKKNDSNKIKDFGLFTKNDLSKIDNKYTEDINMFYFMIASTFITTILDEDVLRKMFGEPILHDEFGEGFDGEWDEESDEQLEPSIKESYASHFVKVGDIDLHIGYDHRGTKIEIKLDKEYSSKPSDIDTEKCLVALKMVVDLYKNVSKNS
jgi:hypothetical protein